MTPTRAGASPAALTIAQAAGVTGWSARMLRYIEDAGLVSARRSPGGFRLYGPGELQRLRTLRELLDEHGVELAEVGFAARLQRDAGLRAAIESWLAAQPVVPPGVPDDDWLRWEQRKHQALLATLRSGAGPGRAGDHPTEESA